MTKDYCLVCGEEMRKWIVKEQCNSMCINSDCIENGKVFRAIEDINNFKVTVSNE